MTTFYPDVSNYQAGLSLAGAPAAMAKATEGTWYLDPTYAGFKAQMAGRPFSAYHYLREGDIGGQAAYAHAAVGLTPLMLDVELGGPVLSWPSLDETYGFIDGYRAGGGVLTTAYIPHWFWQSYWGSPSLTGLAQRGVALISSNYTTYSDTGPGWDPYGGVTPAIWQYTSTQMFNGQRCDFNAFKGDVAALQALFTGHSGPSPMGDDVFIAQESDGGQYLVWPAQSGVLFKHLNPTESAVWQAGGARVVAVVHVADLGTEVAAANTAYWEHMQGMGGGGMSGPVDLTDAAVTKVAGAVVDEEHNRLAN